MDVAPLVEYPLFPHLPTELRLEIWKRALELPRAVPITITAEQQQQPFLTKKEGTFLYND